MATMTKRYQSACARRLRDEAMSQGEARMLESRGIELPEPQRTLINTCTDTDQLKTWFERGLKANAAVDVFA